MRPAISRVLSREFVGFTLPQGPLSFKRHKEGLLGVLLLPVCQHWQAEPPFKSQSQSVTTIPRESRVENPQTLRLQRRSIRYTFISCAVEFRGTTSSAHSIAIRLPQIALSWSDFMAARPLSHQIVGVSCSRFKVYALSVRCACCF